MVVTENHEHAVSEVNVVHLVDHVVVVVVVVQDVDHVAVRMEMDWTVNIYFSISIILIKFRLHINI